MMENNPPNDRLFFVHIPFVVLSEQQWAGVSGILLDFPELNMWLHTRQIWNLQNRRARITTTWNLMIHGQDIINNVSRQDKLFI